MQRWMTDGMNLDHFSVLVTETGCDDKIEGVSVILLSYSEGFLVMATGSHPLLCVPSIQPVPKSCISGPVSCMSTSSLVEGLPLSSRANVSPGEEMGRNNYVAIYKMQPGLAWVLGQQGLFPPLVTFPMASQLRTEEQCVS